MKSILFITLLITAIYFSNHDFPYQKTIGEALENLVNP